ncbi:TetR/AcrR family transcriptional regulator [Corallincola luteus]|uniref:TetR/AcrR family transcriptional regulator n=2 Tax=Corallincola luteus TaxID=1775177 RepID=A0ABY2AHG4_9GAMM|nr:TetR/AcrR family transcriptional regulator [Corallincola luteus]
MARSKILITRLTRKRSMVGRPSEDSRVRQRLIDAAAQLFTSLPYEKVSTRAIATRADSNIGMIRYYFANKAGLFEAVCRQFIDQMTAQLERFVSNSSVDGLGDIISGYYETMAPLPAFPKLVQRAMSLPEDDPSRQIIQRLFTHINDTFDRKIDASMSTADLKPDLDPKLIRMSLISLMVFPFLMPPAIMQMQGIKLDTNFLQRLAKHNKELLKHGLSA